MADNPVSPAEGSPTYPGQEASDEFLEQLAIEGEDEKYRFMAARVPPVMAEDFFAKNPAPATKTPAPKDMEDVRQAKAKRGDPAPNEPKEYIEQGPDPYSLPAHSDNLPRAETGREGAQSEELERRITFDEIKQREEELVKQEGQSRREGRQAEREGRQTERVERRDNRQAEVNPNYPVYQDPNQPVSNPVQR